MPGSKGGSAAVERRLAVAGLVGMSAAFLLYLSQFVPRLTNYLCLDTEFTGWSGPIGERLVTGDIPYVDFTLPIPPGSFALMAGVYAFFDRPLLVHELWVAAIAHLAMGLLGYAIARPFTSRLNALLVVAATWVTVSQINKEIVYDHTAQLTAWASIALGAWGLPHTSAKHATRMLFLAGLLGGFTFAFKQTTALGVIGGWTLALIYVALVEMVSAKSLRRTGRVSAGWLLGVGVGLLLVWALLGALGSPASSYFQAIFGDAPDLKGGTAKLVRHVFFYVFGSASFPASLVLTFALSWVVVRIVRSEGQSLGEGALTSKRLALIVATVVGVLGAAAYLLATREGGLWGPLIFWLKQFQGIALIGLAMSAVLFALGLRRVESATEAGLGNGHAFNATLIVALGVTLIHNTSIQFFRPFYDNNPIIPLAFLGLFIALDRARLPKVKGAVFALILLSLFGDKYQRALEANIPAPTDGYWSGLKVHPRGETVVRAAERVRELAGESGTVLVMPEDVQLRALINRPRPKVQGAILFVDQYPSRLVERDLLVLSEAPPKVIVIHPRERKLWEQLFRLWQRDSGTEKVMDYLLTDLLPKHYEKDLSVPTVFGRKRAHLDVYVRRDDPPEAD